MRITRHGNDLLITDQSVASGALIAAISVLLVTGGLWALLSDEPFGWFQALYTIAGIAGIKIGLDRLVATQLIVDPDERRVITKRWSIVGASSQTYPFASVRGFEIHPQGKQGRTQLMLRTATELVPAAGDMVAARGAWEEVVAAIDAHLETSGGGWPSHARTEPISKPSTPTKETEKADAP